MIDPVVPYERLQTIFGGDSPAEVSRRLDNARVKWLPGKYGRPFTTLLALNIAMGLSSEVDDEDISFGPQSKT